MIQKTDRQKATNREPWNIKCYVCRNYYRRKQCGSRRSYFGVQNVMPEMAEFGVRH